MSIENLTSEQRAALIDFAVLAMYADGHLALRENSAMNKILITLGYDEELDRDRELDLSISRVRNHAGNKEKSMEYIRQVSGAFNTTEGREKIQSMLLEMMSSDDKVTPEEESFLRTVGNLMGK